jgi:hypothetical protein
MGFVEAKNTILSIDIKNYWVISITTSFSKMASLLIIICIYVYAFVVFFSKALASLLLTCQAYGDRGYNEKDMVWATEEPWFISQQG